MNGKKIDWFTLLSSPGSHWAWLSVLLYVAACFLPAIQITSTPSPGYVCLAAGFGIGWWWSNPAYFLALICYAARIRKIAAVFGANAVVIALHFEITTIVDHGLLPGAAMWVASFQLFTVNVIWQVWVDRNRQQQQALDKHSA